MQNDIIERILNLRQKVIAAGYKPTYLLLTQEDWLLLQQEYGYGTRLFGLIIRILPYLEQSVVISEI